MADAMENNHPAEPFFYLAFLAVAPRLQGRGLGGALARSHAQAVGWQTDAGLSGELQSEKQRLYERAGFVAKRNIAPEGAPPLIPMWDGRQLKVPVRNPNTDSPPSCRANSSAETIGRCCAAR